MWCAAAGRASCVIPLAMSFIRSRLSSVRNPFVVFRGQPRALVTTVALLAVLCFMAAGWLTWFSYDITAGLPIAQAIRGIGDMSQATTIFDASDRPVFTIFKEQRIEVPLEKVSPNLIDGGRFGRRSALLRSQRRRCDPRWRGGAPQRAGGAARGRRQHDHAAARPAELPQPRQDLSPQAEGSHSRRLHREPVSKAGDPRAVPEQGLFRRRSLRRRSGVARLLRQERQPS